ncbi:MAG: hypothetical protein ACLUV5_00590 [Oscillospiraceae bacterium]|jgi:hypothetical protein|nr:MAG TPA: hypothetical protein [Caudoviricetes sp.]DAY78845.1 MAG TPA: hypothetical protein [Caudoviricetes sp.]
MIDVSELITDPDFAVPYKVYRRTGKWVKGRFEVSEPKSLNFFGAVQPASVREIQQLHVGDAEHGIMKFFTRKPNDLYITKEFSESEEIQISDEIEFDGRLYKVLQVMPWHHGGWCRAFASLKEDNNGRENTDAPPGGGHISGSDAGNSGDIE